ncbi:MAG: FAD-binding oxidoreductase [Planctomycetota bacterium]
MSSRPATSARAGEAVGRLERELGPGGVSTWREAPDAPELPCAAPDSEEAWSAALRIAAEAGLKVVPAGAGSKASWYRRAETVDLALSTHRWRGVVSYEPGDGTVTARAGTGMADLAATVATGGHHLTPDVPNPERSTLGGVLAAGQSGFDRLRYGPSRHALLGMRALLADGTVARSGGQLVKNVTGYDLHRLYCGSHGTLCVVLEASLRLYPDPEEVRVLRIESTGRDEALAQARELLALPIHHHALWVEGADDEWSVEVALAGRSEIVAHEAGLVAQRLGAAKELVGDAARARVTAARDGLAPDSRWPALELSTRRTDLAGVLQRVDDALRGLGLAPRTIAHPGLAQAWLDLDGLDASAGAALHGALEGLPARVAWRAAPAELRASLPAFGVPPAALAMMRKLRDALDPDGLFAAGRTFGGL